MQKVSDFSHYNWIIVKMSILICMLSLFTSSCWFRSSLLLFFSNRSLHGGRSGHGGTFSNRSVLLSSMFSSFFQPHSLSGKFSRWGTSSQDESLREVLSLPLLLSPQAHNTSLPSVSTFSLNVASFSCARNFSCAWNFFHMASEFWRASIVNLKVSAITRRQFSTCLTMEVTQMKLPEAKISSRGLGLFTGMMVVISGWMASAMSYPVVGFARSDTGVEYRYL